MCALVTGVQTCALPICPTTLASSSAVDETVRALGPGNECRDDRLGCCEGEPLLHEMREFSGSPRRRGARSRRTRGYCSAARRRCASVAMRRTATMERSEEHTSELQSLMRSSYAVVCLK